MKSDRIGHIKPGSIILAQGDNTLITTKLLKVKLIEVWPLNTFFEIGSILYITDTCNIAEIDRNENPPTQNPELFG